MSAALMIIKWCVVIPNEEQFFQVETTHPPLHCTTESEFLNTVLHQDNNTYT